MGWTLVDIVPPGNYDGCCVAFQPFLHSRGVSFLISFFEEEGCNVSLLGSCLCDQSDGILQRKTRPNGSIHPKTNLHSVIHLLMTESQH